MANFDRWVASEDDCSIPASVPTYGRPAPEAEGTVTRMAPNSFQHEEKKGVAGELFQASSFEVMQQFSNGTTPFVLDGTGFDLSFVYQEYLRFTQNKKCKFDQTVLDTFVVKLGEDTGVEEEL
jgi:hypothetical protein